MKKSLLNAAMASSLLLAIAPIFAADAPAKIQAQTQAQEQIYGSQLMTPQERAEHQTKMRNAKTNEAREQIRAQHHKEMQVRAKQQGVTLPDEPPAAGMGGGMGSGGGGR
ncbi:MAG: hypothetical protein B7Z35_11725 [Hydrogenophilales bacterium 12-61-10]|nr:MAG: hypothetical protein B7Z35_11725 [Hydrogenophilales bacterium 12-61-10]OYX26947.1 MAG: hypothetical protein B7Z03_14280 [Hydrogenophilales bacterium 32-62-9]